MDTHVARFASRFLRLTFRFSRVSPRSSRNSLLVSKAANRSLRALSLSAFRTRFPPTETVSFYGVLCVRLFFLGEREVQSLRGSRWNFFHNPFVARLEIRVLRMLRVPVPAKRIKATSVLQAMPSHDYVLLKESLLQKTTRKNRTITFH